TIGFNRSGSKHSSWRNGAINDNNITHNTARLTNQVLRVFTGSNASYSPVGKMAEVICLKTSSNSVRQRIEGYLAHKWGIQSDLDGSHPYASSPPTSNLPLRKISLGTQAVGSFSQNLSGLPMGTNHHLRFLAKNSEGIAFSSIGTFKTIGPASLITVFPANLTPTGATLQATLLSTGEEDPSVTFYWGDNNASDNAGTWDFSQTLSGTHGVGQLSHSIAGLSNGTTYFFTVKAVNSAATAWAPVTTFTANSNLPPNDIQAGSPLVMNENLPINSNFLHFTATDPDAGATVTFGLSDLNGTTQNSLFSMDSNGTLKNATSFDFESNASSYLIRVRASDEFNAFREEEFTITLQNVNEPPTLTSYSASASVALNRLEGEIEVAVVSASDVDSTPNYSINGGADQALFEVNASSGVIRFSQSPDFETPLDSDAGNDYNVTVRASDGSFQVDQSFVFSIVNTEDPPLIDLVGVSSITATTAVIEGNLTAFNGANQPQIHLFYDDNASYHSVRPDPFVPNTISGKLSLWLDANDSNTITQNAGKVSQWTDKSGNYHSLTQDANDSKPSTGVDTQNGLNVLTFDGNDILKRGYSNILDYSQTWIIVVQIDAGGVNNNGDAVLSYGGGNDGRWELRSNNANNFQSKIAKNGSWLQGTLTKTVTLGAYHVFTISFDRANGTLSNWVDGQLRTNALLDPLGLAEKQKITLMGNRANTPQSPAGKVAEVICMRTVDANDRLRMEGYLAHKWDLNGTLDAGHPYVSSAPTLNQPLSHVALGTKPLGTFTHTLTGLSASTSYKYRFQGVSGFGRAFSSTGSFTTAGLAQVIGVFPTNTTPTSATIRSQILSTGGEDGTLTFFWGDDNASNVAANWDSNHSLTGLKGVGLYGHPISGLSAGVNYFYTSRVVNSAGASWAPVRTFLATSNDAPNDIIPGPSLSMPENLALGSAVVDFNATDPDAGATLTLTLNDQNGTTQNNLFTLDSNGTLRTAANFDFENNASAYLIRVRATDQFSAFREESFTISLTDVNEAPLLSSFDGAATYTLNVHENQRGVAIVSAQDPEASSLTYSLSGGADQAFFELNATTGALSFAQAPDFETAQDAGTNNGYEVAVQASDGVNAVTQTLTVSVTNLNEAPIVQILPTSAITGTSATIEGNLTAYTGGTQPTLVLQYDDDSTYQVPRPIQSPPFSLGPKLALWLDANDSSTITHLDGNVSQWSDKSGNNLNMVQETNASKPKTALASHNGLNLISFDGDDFLQRAFSNVLNRNLTCFLVARVDTGGISSAQDALLSYGNGGNGKWELRSANAATFNSKLAKNST
ncbi:MAG: cadherin repeat domain-containing protein, partial [Verrucomicrobiota bacterium]|nr:cadherin repeat domain-containing protein [Verrucomicrobiota bacterium]